MISIFNIFSGFVWCCVENWPKVLTLSNTGFFRLSLHGGGGGGDGKWSRPVTLEIFNRLETEFGTLIQNHKSIRLMCFNWLVTSL